MDTRTVVAWMQLAAGSMFLVQAYVHWRAGRKAWKGTIMLGGLAAAIGVQVLTTGWVHDAARAVAGIGTTFVLAQMFTARDRFGLWSALVFTALALPIVIVELRFDDLTAWQWALFAGVGAVFATLMVVTIVRLRSYKRVALPSA